MSLELTTINPAFICPITQCEMDDPVIAPDGFTYDKSAIQAWFNSGHVSSPLTREKWNSQTLIPNRALKELIEASHNSSSTVISNISNVVKAPPPPINMEVKRIKNTNNYHISLNVDDNPDSTIPTLFIDVLDISGSMRSAAVSEENLETEGGNFSRCDLVKHCVSTQINLLREKDELSIVLFDDKARTILNPTLMTSDGKNKATKELHNIYPQGGTNIWGGLKHALDIAKKNQGKNIVIILQTDGESQQQYSPPTGIHGAFQEWKEENADIKLTLHTVGLSYGSSLDSPLLLQLAYTGNGTINYIPDGSMVGTVFIHLMSNLMSCVYKGVHIRIEGDTKPKFLNVGFIQGKQSRDFIVESDNDFTLSLITDNIIDSQNKTIKINSCEVEESGFISVRDHFLKVLQKALYDKERSIDVTSNLQTLNTFLKEKSDEQSIALSTDFDHIDKYKGQIMKAFETANFAKWGRHYIPSVISAHRFQWGNNFKDESSKYYGGKTVKSLIKQGNRIFIELPSPTPSIPSRKQYTQSNSGATNYVPSNIGATLNANGGCFSGNSMIEMQDGSFCKAINIEKYDKVAGGAQVVCILKIYYDSPVEICTIGNNKKCEITPWHPIFIDNKWIFPIDINKPYEIYKPAYTKEWNPVLYNFVLDSGHILNVDGIKAVTLGHKFKGPVIEHSYFGDKIIEDLIKSDGWIDDYVKWKNISIIRDETTNMIIKINHE